MDATEFKLPALYDDNRIAYDLLRFHDAFVLRQSVRELISPATLFPRNYVTNNDECVVRMTQLHIDPWLSMYVSPSNAIVLDEHFPLLPAEVTDGWREIVFDHIVLDYKQRRTKLVADSSSSNQQAYNSLSYEIAPVDASTVIVPSSNLAILNFGDSPDVIRLNSSSTNGPNSGNDNFCSRDIKLSMVLNTDEDFGLADLDTNRPNVGRPSYLQNRDEKKYSPGTTIDASRPDDRDDFLSFLRTY